jgi:hypothetical protein
MKLQVPYDKEEVKLEERCRMKLLSGTHHHHAVHHVATAEGDSSYA